MEEIEQIFELSPMQQAMLVHSLSAPGSGIYLLQTSLRLTGRLDVAAFERAWQHAVDRHATLRTAFFWEDLEKPLQVVYRQIDLEVTHESWRGIGPERQRACLTDWLEADRERGFDPAEAPLMRLALIELDTDVYQLVWTLHHLVVDGWSQGTLLRELFACYAAFVEGMEPRLPLPGSYREYIAWLQRQDPGTAESFWRRSLGGFSTPTLLAGATGRRTGASFRESRRRDLILSREVSDALREMARRHRLTLNTLVQGAWALLLAQATGRQDVVFGTTVAGRPAELPGVESIVGLFINTLPARVEVRPEQRLTPWLAGLQRAQVEMRLYEHAPLVDVQRWSELPPGTPLFDHFLVFENLALPEELSRPFPGLEIAAEASHELAGDSLYLVIVPDAGLRLSMRYDTACFAAPDAARMLERLARLLETFAEDGNAPLAELPLLLEGERHQALVEWNDTRTAYPRQACLAELFAAVARQQPEAPALLATAGEAWSYRRLDEESNRLARRLRLLGVGTETAVGIAMERSPELILGTLAILKAGGMYVPLDASYPDGRLGFMLKDTGARLVLVHAATRERMAGLAQVLPIEDPDWRREPSGPLDLRVPAGCLAYVIYTSGSTGRPKGVAVPQRAIARLVRETNYVRLGPGDRTGQVANISFDAATYEIWGALLTGAAVVVIPRETVLSPTGLARAIREQGVTSMFLTSALFTRMAREVPDAFETLSELLVGGEAVDPAAARAVLASRPPRRLLNGYGPTESTTFAAWHPIREVPEAATNVPIGGPLANTSLFVLDPWHLPVPPGVVGELCIGGDGLARGYLNRPELTAERFVPHPWGHGDRLYRTGDLVRQRPDGAVEYLGRLDHQVKIRGFRIEPGEIEAVLAGHPEIRQCAVIARREGATRLVAYAVFQPGSGLQNPPAALRAWLQERLPEHMLPSAFVIVDALPLTANGKLDRRALPAPESTGLDEAGSASLAAPSDPIEELMAGIWADVLGRDRFGVHDDFFALGGHSLLATQVISRIREVLGAELPLRRLFEAPTVAGLARAVRDAGAAGAPPIVPVPRDCDLPLSFAQQRLWLIDQLEPGSSAYNVPLALRLTGALSTSLLERIFAEIVRRHEVLRTTFEAREGGPVQVIAPPGPTIPLPLIDLSADPGREARARVLALEEARRPFDLRHGPLLRLLLVRLAEREHILLVSLHHIVSDGWSMGVLLREVAALHEGSPLPALPVQYADFAVWQRSWLQGEVLEAQLDHWKRRLAGAPAVLELPLDRPRPGVQTFRGAVRPTALGLALSDAVGRLCRERGVTPFMALLAAWAVLLGRHAGQDDVLLGSPIAGRNRREAEGLIGFFVNTLVLRSDLSGNPSFAELLERVRRTALDAFTHQDLPFERIVEEVVAERSLSVSPLFQVMFALQNAPLGSLELPGMALSPIDVDAGVAKLDLSLTLRESPAGFAGTLEHNAALFDGTTADRILRQLRELLAGAVRDPGWRLLQLPLLAESERHQILLEWAGSRFDSLVHGLVQDLFRTRAARAPEAVALVAGGAALTYGELAARVGRLARRLVCQGVGPEVTVGICLEAPAEIATAMLAVLEAGGAFLPLDPAYPAERRKLILEDAQAAILLSQLDEWIEGPDEEPAAAPAPCLPENLAYVIYTSGTTGQPKGVGITHHTLVPILSWGIESFGLGEHTRVLQNLAPWFDFGVFEILTTLLAGGTLHIPDDRKDASRHGAYLREHRINTLHSTPSFFREMLAAGEILPDLEILHLGGEALFQGALRRMFEVVGERCHVYNGYGPTEATINCSLFDAGTPGERRDRHAAKTAAAVPIGRAMSRHTLYVKDRNGEPTDLAGIGIPGELYVGGDGLARGYLNRPGLTAERFQPDPFSTTPGTRLYRTGDLVRVLPTGDLEFLGRIDQQVKLRGLRIELGEIETVLAAHPGVREVVVLVREDRPGDQRLVAYVAAAASGAPTAAPSTEDLRQLAGTRLPVGLIPSALVFLDAFPRTTTGKVDRKALPAPQATRAADVPSGAPSDPIEELLAGIWSDVLGIERLGVHEDFFALGGHSLLATQVASRIRGLLGTELPLRQLFEAPTIAGLARAVRETGNTVQAPPFLPVPRDGDLPLSFAQQRLWLIDRIDPGNPVYNMPLALRLRGEIDTGLLERIFAEIVRRHEALRTTFTSREGLPVQVIAPPEPLAPRILDLSRLPGREREAQARELTLAEARRPFDLGRGPLLRLLLVRLAGTDHLLLLTLHHIVADGWSMGVLLREIAALHEAFAQGLPSPLPELPVQYADFSIWQRSWLQGEILEAQLDHWKQRLAGAPAVLELPLDRPRPAAQTFRGASRPLHHPASVSQAVRELCRREQATPFMALLAAWALLLGCHAGQEDVLVGTPIAGRNRREIEGLIGFFVNTLVLRTDLSGGPGFGEVVRRVRAAALDAFSHQDLPFERLVEEVVEERSLAVSPLFQVMFSWQNAPPENLSLSGLELSPVEVDTGLAKFDLSLVLQESPAGFLGALDHNADLFDGTTIERMLGQLRQLLAGAVKDPELRLQDLPLLTAGERQQVLIEWTGSRSSPAEPEGSLVRDLFRARTARAPGAVALMAGGTSLTCGELAARVDRLARRLACRGVGPEMIVGISLAAPLDIVTAMLAVLEAGGAFLPLDPAYPAERRSFILDDARAALVLTGLDEWLEGPDDVAAPGPALCLPENLAYVIYTSGTTGRPKGVGITHQTLVPMLAWGIETFGLGGHTRVLQNLAPWFDFGVFEILTTLLAGGTLYLPDERADVSRQAASLREHRIGTLHSTPSFFREVLATGEALPDLEILHLGGEALHQGAVQRIFDAVGDRCRLYNGYGPTEATINCALFDVGLRSDRRDRGAAAIPIGRATARHTLYVLNRHGVPVGIGIPGELHVGGEGLARGYLRRPALTAGRFVPDPFSATPGARLYRTGDLVRFLPAGDLEILGRIDQQIKLRGLRIELGEIEAVLAGHPGVREVVVHLREDRPGDRRLVAYAVGAAESPPEAEELRRLAGVQLPAALVPSAIVFLDSFPRTATGKVDRKALPAPDRTAGPEHLGPRDSLELELVRIWEEVLGLGPIGVRDDFFALGGHSLLAVQVTSRIESRLGRRLPLAALLRHPTVERLAALLREEGSLTPSSPLVELAAGAGRPLFLVHPIGGEVLCYVPLARHLGGRPLYGLQADTPAASIEEMAARYLRHVREVQPEGPYLLGGWSLGGTVAYEMAHQLEASGEAVERVILIDAYAPGERWRDSLEERKLVAAFAVDLARLLGIGGLALPESFESLATQAEELGVLSRKELESRFALFAAHSRAAARYAGGPCAAPLLLIRAAEPAGGEPDRGWGAVAGQPVEAHELPGDHYTLLQKPFVESLAGLLRK